MEKGFTQLNWSYPLETILLSSPDGTDRTVTIAPEEDLNFEGNYRKLKTNQFIFRKWEIRNDSWLNPKYFHLDRGTYKPLADSTPNNDLDYLGRNLEIKIHARPYYRTNDTVWMPVTVFNRAATPLHTGGRNNLSFSYLWIKNENEVTWNTISTPLDCDVVHSLTQYIRVAIPGTPGKFELKVDIRTGDGSWMGIKSGAEILVY
jgi:hypothetical protein